MLVGRTRELEVIGAALADAAGGDGRLVVLAGPAGIGKSRLAREAARLATERGLVVARSHAVDDPGVPALWPWRRLIQDWPGADGVPASPGEGPDARFRLFTAIGDVLAMRCTAAPCSRSSRTCTGPTRSRWSCYGTSHRRCRRCRSACS